MIMGLFKKNSQSTSAIYDDKFRNLFNKTITSVAFRNLINVEGGHVGIATKWLPSCLKCDNDYHIKECGECGRNAENYIDFRAGDGDGIYPVYSLFSNDMFVGGMIFFDPQSSINSIGNLYTEVLGQIGQHTDDEKLIEELMQFEALPQLIPDSYTGQLSIYQLGELKAKNSFKFSNKKFAVSEGYLIISDSGEGIDSDCALSSLLYLEPGNYNVFLIGGRDEENNNILKPSVCLILNSVQAAEIGLLNENIQKLDLAQEKTLWNDSTVFAAMGAAQNHAASYSNAMYYLRFTEVYELQEKSVDEIQALASNAAGWLMMMHQSNSGDNFLKWVRELTKLHKIDISGVHEIRGQLNRKIV
jgi:hypothetical protein